MRSNFQSKTPQPLINLLKQHAAPFREQWVRGEITAQLESANIDWCLDSHGNLIAGVDNLKNYQKLLNQQNSEPLRLLIAHMDHPGFHGSDWIKPGHLRARWLGGGPVQHLRGGLVWIADDNGIVGNGYIQKSFRKLSGQGIETLDIRLDPSLKIAENTDASKLYGGLDFEKSVVHRGKKIYCRAADDLTGVHIIIETLKSALSSRRKHKAPVVGLFTRAEEVGFIGLIGHLNDGYYENSNRQLLAISLEASRTGPGATIGKGPVIRLGDKRTAFSPAISNHMRFLGQRCLPQNHQIKLLDGGACEAAATMAWGIPTAGIAVPLGNYHNQGFEGGPGCKHPQGPAMEFVHQDDIKAAIKLCTALASSNLSGKDLWASSRRAMNKHYREYAKLLRG